MNQSFYRYPWGESSSRFIGPILPFLGGLLIGGIVSRPPCSGPYCYPTVYPPRPIPMYPPYYGPYNPMTPPIPNYGPYPPQPGIYDENLPFTTSSPYPINSTFPNT